MSIEHLENKGQNYVAGAEYFKSVRRVGKMGIPPIDETEQGIRKGLKEAGLVDEP